jgi:streptogramin lyase
VLLVALASSLGVAGAAAAGGGVGTITEYPLPPGSGNESSITFGVDGRLWFPESFHDQVGAITTKGVLSSYPLASGSGVYGARLGPDGNLWLAEHDGRKIGVMNTSGNLVTEYPSGTYTQPFDIAAGADGSLWWTDEEYGVGKIGRITTGGTITEYTGLTSFPRQITAGPDGNLWFTENYNGGNSKIGRITTAGSVTEFPLANANAGPYGIAAGPDGNVWFTESAVSGDKIGRITPSGTITEYPVPTAQAAPEYIAAGPDGNLWFTEEGGNKVGRITPAGAITEFTIPTSSAAAVGITVGPDGNMWFVEGAHKVARVSVAAKNTGYALVTDAGVVAKTIKLKKQGTTAEWVFEGPSVHTVTDSSGMGLFDSGDRLPVSYYLFAFSAAGSYPFRDTHNHQVKGTVSVPIVVTLTDPSDASATWSSSAPPSGYVFDVQVEQPGSTTFLDWKTSQTATSASFGPGDPLYVGAGTYSFRARLRKVSNGAASGYSAPKAVTLS